MDERNRALNNTFNKTTKQLASELGREEDFDFEARRLVRNVASEALNLQSRVGHVFRNRDKMEWTDGAKTDLKAILTRLEYSAGLAREVLAAQEPSETILEAAE